MTHDIRTVTRARDERVRQSQRMAMNIPGQLTVRGRTYDVLIQNLSRFGAFVTDLPAIARGTVVELAIALQGPGYLATEGTVMHWMDETAAARVGTVPGAGIRFHVAVDDLDTAFDAAITCLLAQRALASRHGSPVREEKPTRRMLRPVRSSLVAAMNLVTPASDGRIVLAGSLAVIELPDLLTGLALRRTSGRLELERDHVVATIDLSDGDVVDARSSVDEGDAREVMRMLLYWSGGSFRLLSAAPLASPATVRMKVSQLLIEHVRVYEDSLPALPTVRFRSGSDPFDL
jgi:hypothetical protein